MKFRTVSEKSATENLIRQITMVLPPAFTSRNFALQRVLNVVNTNFSGAKELKAFVGVGTESLKNVVWFKVAFKHRRIAAAAEGYSLLFEFVRLGKYVFGKYCSLLRLGWHI